MRTNIAIACAMRQTIRTLGRGMIVLAALAAGSGEAARSQELPGDTASVFLHGIVYGPDGRGLEGVQVMLDGFDLVALTDAEGRWGVDMSPGEHEITFTKPGYELRTYRFILPADAGDQVDMGGVFLDERREVLATVTGTVVDSVTVEPVAAAQIKLDDLPSTITNVTGNFRFDQVKPGFHTLEIRRIGYRPTFVDFEIPAGRDRVDLTLKVAQLPSYLPEVTVEGRETIYAEGKLREFYQRMQRGWGHYITRDQIEKRSARVPSELLYGVPGISVIPGPFGRNTIRLSRVTTGCQSPVVFLDGARIRGGDLDEILNPQDIAGIEIYTRASNVPPEFNIQGAAACGVIVVWTREGGS